MAIVETSQASKSTIHRSEKSAEAMDCSFAPDVFSLLDKRDSEALSVVAYLGIISTSSTVLVAIFGTGFLLGIDEAVGMAMNWHTLL
jgi:hypothetical protein